MTKAERAFAGSKRKTRFAEFEMKGVERTTHQLRLVRLLSQRLGSIYELDAYLTKVTDAVLRESVRKMVLAFRPDLARN